MKKQILVFISIFSLSLTGCRQLTPKLPEAKEATIKELLEAPENFQGVEIRLTGILTPSLAKGLVFKEGRQEIKVSTQSSGIEAEDFLGELVEVGGLLKEEADELVLEMNWVGIVPQEGVKTMAEEKRGLLAEFLEVDDGEIEIVSSEAVDWPSSALGAPEPGKLYLQVITPGFKIVYRAQGNAYEVHTNQDGSQAVLLNPRAEL